MSIGKCLRFIILFWSVKDNLQGLKKEQMLIIVDTA